MLPQNIFFDSTISVSQNAVKNILFRVSAILLHFVVCRYFALLAFKRKDYTSFLMFAEDIIQKAFFVTNRRFNKQATLVIMFAGVTFAVSFYDTLIWAVDSPGSVLRTSRVSAASLSTQILPNRAYVTFIANNISDIDIETTLGTNLYSIGLNFSLPGINTLQRGEVVPEQIPLADGEAPRIWLDTDGFAVGLDQTIMWRAGCEASNVASDAPGTKLQAWACPTNNTNALNIFESPIGTPQIWWDFEHQDWLRPNRKDNPWFSLQRYGETGIMKQVFTLTKDTRRHTFMQTMLKATLLGIPELEDEQITDIIRRTWATTGSSDEIEASAKILAGRVLSAKSNGTSYVFGAFGQQNDTLSVLSVEFLNIPKYQNNISSEISYSVLRTVVTDTVLISSETLASPPLPYGPCSLVFTNVATGGTVRGTNCNTAAAHENQKVPNTGPFLGQVDTSAVVIMSDVLGDGTMSTSAGALNQSGLDWYLANTAKLDQLLTSRALIMGGAQNAVMVDTTHLVAAISYLQISLVLLPVILLLAVTALTLGKPMSYYGSSFLSAVLATTHVTTEKCLDIGYIRRLPEIVLWRTGDHFVLKTPFGGTIANVAGENVGGMILEPLLLKAKNDEGKWDT